MKLPERQYRYLEDLYAGGGGRIVILYGQKYAGKREIVKAFSSGKPTASYTALKCEDRHQRRIMREYFHTDEEYPGYDSIFAMISGNARKGRLVLAIYDFENVIRSDSDFMQQLVSFVASSSVPGGVLVLLISSSVGFVENDLVKRLGSLSRSVAGFLKIPVCSFFDLKEYFPAYSPEDRLGVYAVLGGRPGMYTCFDPGKSLRENIENVLLDRRGALSNEAELRLMRSLRETAVYSSILMSVASGDSKLNDIHKTTGFSRAKISVYLENLISLEVAEKIFSEETGNMDNAKKGIYGISDPLMLFWYRYVFPRESELSDLSPRDFYDRYIGPGFKGFCEDAFREAVAHYVEADKTISGGNRCGIWEGKKGRLDLISEKDDGTFLAGICSYEKGVMGFEQYEDMLKVAKSAKISISHTVLAAGEGFDESLMKMKDDPGFTLLTLKDLDRK
ncbi:MAG: ATP-binding protein [Lachnospiraceae bacterium]|nr:ATP-binding protein [Lachnospiraceae bacterium]